MDARPGPKEVPMVQIPPTASALALSLVVLSGARGQTHPPLPTEPSPSVFVFLQRTKGHIKYSQPEVFQSVIDGVFAHLQSAGVAMAHDELAGRRSSEEEMSVDTVQRIARSSRADSLLYVVVDRPITKWIRVTATCYDPSGNVP